MTYSLFIEKAAQKALSKISNPHQARNIDAIYELKNDPRPTGVKKLIGRNAWRIRIGDYRVIYEIHDTKLVVLVVTIAHRKDVYR